MLRNPAGTGGAREPKHDASTLRAWQGQPLDGQRVAVRHVVSGPGRIVRRSAIFWPRTIATFRRESLRVVPPTASPRPMLVAIAPLGEMVMENKTMREQRQAMLLLIVQTRIKRRRRVRDRLQILTPGHCAFAAVPQPVNETCGLGLVLEFFTPLQGALRGSAQRRLDGGPELLLVRRQFQTGMEGSNARVKESGAIGGRENMLFRLGRNVGRGLLRVAAKGAKRNAGTNNGDHSQGGRQTRFHGNSPFRLLHDPRIWFRQSRDHVHLHHKSNRQGCRRLQMKLSSCSLIPKNSRADRNGIRRQYKWRIPINAGSRADVHSVSEISIEPGVDGGPSRPCRQGS